MTVARPFHPSPRAYLMAEAPDEPVLFLSPEALQTQARRFIDGFPGLVTYAVKANSSDAVIANLTAAGITGFDVASPAEIALIQATAPGATLHYNNPVRSRAEVLMAIDAGVASYAVDDMAELDKLSTLGVPLGTEIAVRFKLPVAGAAYDFGAKFGATPKTAADILAEATRRGYRPALTFHPGTQCIDPTAWQSYIARAADIAHAAGVMLERLNVGGGFPSRRNGGHAPDLDAIFAAIGDTTQKSFGSTAPALVCEPGRAMVAEAVSLALRVKALRNTGDVFLNDGIYGALAEQPIMGMTDRIEVIAPNGTQRNGPKTPRTLWGPTCDSLDRMPGAPELPQDMEDGDYMLIHGMGAYSTATVTRFNGYGDLRTATVRSLEHA